MDDRWKLAGRITAEARDFGKSMIREGESLLKVAEAVERFIRDRGAEPAFPVNIAINNVAAHFTPRHDDGDLVFERGNLVKLDVGAHVGGYIGDSAVTVEVGTRNYTEHIRAAQEALEAAIEVIRPGIDVSNIGEVVENVITSYGLRPVRNLTGHTIERYSLHAGLSVPNVKGGEKGTVREGMVVAIEPFATDGIGAVDGKKNSNIYRYLRHRVAVAQDVRNLMSFIEENYKSLPFAERWCTAASSRAQFLLKKLMRLGAVTFYPVLQEVGDGMVAQAEHTLYIAEDGPVVLTRL